MPQNGNLPASTHNIGSSLPRGSHRFDHGKETAVKSRPDALVAQLNRVAASEERDWCYADGAGKTAAKLWTATLGRNRIISVRKLHIGGHVRKAGWEVLDVNPGPHVDHVCNAADLTRFATATFTEVYASHVLEHFDYKDALPATLKEWHRVLTPGGMLHVSVPDMDTLARLFLDRQQLSAEDRFLVMRMMFGGHVDQYDYHVVGLNEEFLLRFLYAAGFAKAARVPEFGICDDTSTLTLKGTPISLNVTALKGAA